MRNIVIAFVSLLTLLSCKNGNPQKMLQQAEAAQPEQVADTLLKMPDVPLTITDRGERAAFVVEHFWDNLDFSDTLRSLNKPFMEQNFANYLSIFNLVDIDRLGECVAKTLAAARVEPKAHELMADIAYKYLYEPNSPMASDEYYKLFLNALIADESVSPALKERYRFQLECINKNLPGSLAANFTYIDREGKRGNLLTTSVTSKLLLIFYDPDCDHCKEIIAHMRDDLHIDDFVAAGQLTILAVDAEGDRELWNSTMMELSQAWRVAYDLSDIRGRNTYVLRALPSLYLLDADKRIILKDAPSDEVYRVLCNSLE